MPALALVECPESPPEDRLIRVAEVARLLDCSPQRVRALGRHGELVIHKLGPRSSRVTESSLRAYLDRTRG